MEKELTDERVMTADQEDGCEAVLIKDEGIVPEDQSNDKTIIADIEEQDSDRADNEKQAKMNEKENNNSATASICNHRWRH